MTKSSRLVVTILAIAMSTAVLGNGASSQTGATPVVAQQPAPVPSPKPAATKGVAITTGHADAARSSENGRTYVYLLRGLMNIFSLGMDDLAAKLQQHGVAAGVYEYGQWEALCHDAARRWQSSKTKIVIVGHSLGGDAVIYMANKLGQMGIPVALVVAFDPVHPVPLTGGTTARFVNLYQSNNGWGAAVPRGGSFRGELSNVDLRSRSEIGHVSIDKSARLHQIVISRVLGLGGSPKPKPVDGAATPPVAQPSSDAVRPVLVSPPSRPASQTQ